MCKWECPITNSVFYFSTQKSMFFAPYHRTINYRKICNALLDALMCPLQIINYTESLSLTVHGVNACFIHHPSNAENYLISHKSETNHPKQKK